MPDDNRSTTQQVIDVDDQFGTHRRLIHDLHTLGYTVTVHPAA